MNELYEETQSILNNIRENNEKTYFKVLLSQFSFFFFLKFLFNYLKLNANLKLSENKLNECEKELNKMKEYFDVSLFEINASRLHKLKLEYNTICQILNNEDTTWFINNNKKSLNDLNMQLELNDDFVSNPKIQTSTPRNRNDSLKYHIVSKIVDKIDKSVATYHEISTQTEVIVEETNVDDEEINLNENKIHVQFEDQIIAVEPNPKTYQPLDIGISGDNTISEQRTEDEREKTKSEESSQESTDEDNNETMLRKRLPEVKGLETFDKRSTLTSSTTTVNGNVKTTFVKKLFRFLILFLLFCTILISLLYPLMKPTCGITRKEYFLKYIYMDEENFNKGPIAY